MPGIRKSIGLLGLGTGLLLGLNAAWGQNQVIVVPASSLPVVANSRPVQPGQMPALVDRSAVSLPQGAAMALQVVPSGMVQARYVGPEPPAADAPILAIEKTGPASFMAGQPAAYSISVRNTSVQPLLHVRVEDELSVGARFLKAEPSAVVHETKLIWNIDRMERGEERRFRVEFVPTSKGDLQARATAYCSCNSALAAHVFALEISLDIKGPQTVQTGETAEYQIQLHNTGDVPAPDVMIRDELPDGLTHAHGNSIEAPLGTLAPGDHKTLPVRVKVTHKGLLQNHVYVLSENKVVAERIMQVQAEEPLVALHALDKQDVLVNHDLEMVLEIIGTGPAPTTATLTDHLPEGIDFISAGEGGKYDEALRTVTWKCTGLTADRAQTLRIKAAARKVGDWPTDITVQSERAGDMRFRQVVHVEVPAGVKLEMAEKDEPIEVDAEKVYSVHLINQGESPTRNVAVRTVIPNGMAFVSAESPTRFHEKDQEVAFEPIAEMQGKSEATFQVRVRALKAGEWKFRVSISCEQNDKPICKEECTPVVEAAKK